MMFQNDGMKYNFYVKKTPHPHIVCTIPAGIGHNS